MTPWTGHVDLTGPEASAVAVAPFLLHAAGGLWAATHWNFSHHFLGRRMFLAQTPLPSHSFPWSPRFFSAGSGGRAKVAGLAEALCSSVRLKAGTGHFSLSFPEISTSLSRLGVLGRVASCPSLSGGGTGG